MASVFDSVHKVQFVETAAIKNIVTRVLLAKGKDWPKNAIAIERVAEFLEGGKELSRDEKDEYFIDSNAAYKEIIDYQQLHKFSYKAFLPLEGNKQPNCYPSSPDYSLDASWIDSDGAYAYTMSMHLNILQSCSSVEFTSTRRIRCPPHKKWVVGYIQWDLAAAPEGTYEYNWVGKNAGVEMVAGFVWHIDSKGMVVDPEMLQRDRMNVEVISSKFDLIGYACFSPLELLGADFYRFSIRKGGEVRGNTLSLAPAIPWQNPMVGRAFKVPEYCDLSVSSANPALKDLGSANCIDDLMSSFSNLAVKVEDGKVPTLTVTDVVVLGRQHRQGRFENEWTPNVARAFGDVLKAIKRNNHGITMPHELSSAKRKIDENDEAKYLEIDQDVVLKKTRKRV